MCVNATAVRAQIVPTHDAKGFLRRILRSVPPSRIFKSAVYGGPVMAMVIALLFGLWMAGRGSRGAPVPAPAQVIGVPVQVPHWKSFSSERVSEVIARLRTTYGSAMPSGVTAVARGYERDSGERVLVIGFNAQPRTTAVRELESPQVVLKALLSRAGVYDAIYPFAGRLGGMMACGDSMLARPTTFCVWVGKTVIASVTFTSSTPDNGIAARLSRELLSRLLNAQGIKV